VVFELVHPGTHDLLKFLKAKITGYAQSKLMVKDLTHSWELVKATSEENYVTRCTVDYHACKMFSARQGKNESTASWENKIDELQTDLREAARLLLDFWSDRLNQQSREGLFYTRPV